MEAVLFRGVVLLFGELGLLWIVLVASSGLEVAVTERVEFFGTVIAGGFAGGLLEELLPTGPD